MESNRERKEEKTKNFQSSLAASGLFVRRAVPSSASMCAFGFLRAKKKFYAREQHHSCLNTFPIYDIFEEGRGAQLYKHGVSHKTSNLASPSTDIEPLTEKLSKLTLFNILHSSICHNTIASYHLKPIAWRNNKQEQSRTYTNINLNVMWGDL